MDELGAAALYGSYQGCSCMGQLKQENRFLTITDFSLGKDTFVISALEGSESVSGLFEFQLDVLSENLEISPDKIVGKAVTATVHTDEPRYFNGFVKSFTFGEISAHNHRQYRIVMVPWLWFLDKSQDCRIFQKKTTKEIVEAVFSQAGFSDFDFKAAGGQVREYCVQYNETNFEFVSRLLEEDGIAYYFTHSKDKHQLILVDKPNAYEEVAQTDLEFSKGNMPNSQITAWERVAEFRKGQWTLNDYNFLEPTKDLKASSNSRSAYANNSKFEHYEYPGFYDPGIGKDIVKIRLEAEESLRETVHGASDCSSFYAGGKFSMAKHDTATEHGGYILVGVNHQATDTSFFTGEEGESGYDNDFICIPEDVPFRPQPVHQKPYMKGPQSALVVGPSGEEIYIDEYSRIKVQFFWDREGKNDENSTCFIRVMQSLAGSQWGTSFIPRIGQEVIVNFLDGDPDRPLVTGAVYNAKNKPVYEAKTQSGIKTRSTKGGNAQNYNELRFEDKKGSEQVYIHAEKDFDSHVENNQSLTVENDRSKDIGNDESYSVGANRSKDIGGNQTETIGKDKSTRVKGNHVENVGKNMTINIDKDKNTSVSGNHVESVGKNMTINIEKDLRETVSGSYVERVTKDSSHSAKTITFKADKQITLQTGSAKIVMKSNGDITISGKNINVKGSGNVVLKGSKVTSN